MRTRTTVELVALMLAATVCFAVLAAGSTVAVVEIRDPSVDTSEIVEHLTDFLGALLGAVLGFLAGRNYHDERKDGPS